MFDILSLKQHLPICDVRKLIYKQLGPSDYESCIRAYSRTNTNKVSTEFVCDCIARGYLDRLRWAWPLKNRKEWSRKLSEVFVRTAVENGHFEIVKWLVGMGCSPEFICDEATRCGQLEILKEARKGGYKWVNGCIDIASDNGHFETVVWANKHGCPREHTHLEMCMNAHRHGRMDLLKYLVKNGFYHGDEDELFLNVNRDDIVSLVKWWYENELPLEELIADALAYNEMWDGLFWAIENGFPYSPLDICRSAITKGNIEMFTRFETELDNDTRLNDTEFCQVAADKGQLEMLIYLHKRGYQWNDKFIFQPAARSGHLHVLKWLHSIGYEFNYVVATLACNGLHRSTSVHSIQLEILKWCIESDIEWREESCRHYAKDVPIIMDYLDSLKTDEEKHNVSYVRKNRKVE